MHTRHAVLRSYIRDVSSLVLVVKKSHGARITMATDMSQSSKPAMLVSLKLLSEQGMRMTLVPKALKTLART